jgi:hypothetical protein
VDNRTAWALCLVAYVLLGLLVAVASHFVVPVDAVTAKLSLLSPPSAGGYRLAGTTFALLVSLWALSWLGLWQLRFKGRQPWLLVAAWLPAFLSVPWSGADVFLYLAQAFNWTGLSLNPYLVSPAYPTANPFQGLQSWVGAPAGSGPLDIVLNALLSQPQRSPWLNLLVMRTLASSLLFGASLLAARIAGALAVEIQPGTWWLLLGAPLLVTEVGVAAHNDAWIAFALTACVYAVLERHWGLAVLCFGASALIKYSTLVLVPPLFVGFMRFGPATRREWTETVLGAAAVVAASLCLASAFGGPAIAFRGVLEVRILNTHSLAWLLVHPVAGYSGTAALANVGRGVTVMASLALAWGVRRPEQLVATICRIYVIFLLCGVSWFQPWYVVPLVVLAPLAGEVVRGTALILSTTSLIGLYGVYFSTYSWQDDSQTMISAITFVPVLLFGASRAWMWIRRGA